MRDITTIQQAEEFLLAYSPQKQSGETYTLGRMKRLMELLGNPQNDIPAIHVAGTSGKTSTAYFIRALLEARGQKTGLTASPHISSITERVQVGGTPLDDDVFIRYLNEFIGIVRHWPELEPTYFELLVAFAFWVFKKEDVDYMVIEVGLGGLLDGTNVITSNTKISVITPIGLDHTEVLGTTLRQIAAQKAGIITRDSWVFSAEQVPEASTVIEERCHRLNSQLHIARPTINMHSDTPVFQQRNFWLAKQVVDYVARRDGLPAIAPQAEQVCITKTPPGRFEVYELGEKTVILDGAHNPQKLAAFMESLKLRISDQRCSWLVGFVDAPQAKIEACVAEIRRPHDEYIFTEFTVGQDIKGRRSVTSPELDRIASNLTMNSVSEPNMQVAFERLLVSPSDTLIITGSLYLVSQLRLRLKRSD